MSKYRSHYINHQWHHSSGEEFHSLNPATNEIIWTGSQATKQIVESAVNAAKEAFNSWAELPLSRRIGYLEVFQNTLNEQKETLATAISQETGKPLWEARTEVNAMHGKIKISKESYLHRCQELTSVQGIYTSKTRHKPHGVLAVFGPFNFPGHLPNGHIIPALIAGNTVILKPSELTPLTAETMIHCWEQCHLPEGVINMVQGDAITGHLLATHSGIDGLLFTGSWTTGLKLAEIFAQHPDKILALEMGGNNPYVIGTTENLTAAAYLTIHSAYLTAGQRCTCARRLIVPHSVHTEPFLKCLIQMIKQIRVAPYTEIPEPYMGPVITKEAAKGILAIQEQMLAQGGKALVKMRILKEHTGLLTPGLIDVTKMEPRQDQEIFGPLLQLIRVPDFEAALDEANRTAYGLAAGLISDEEQQYEQFYKHIHAGVINWNTPLTGASSQAPFGGVGHSGNHRPSAYYAADYCSYPTASLEAEKVKSPPSFPPGITLPKEQR